MILGELCMGGMVLETNMADILTHVAEQDKLEKSEVSVICPSSLPLFSVLVGLLGLLLLLLVLLLVMEGS